MKTIKNILRFTADSFTLLMLIFAVLVKFTDFGPEWLLRVVPLFAICALNSTWVVLRDYLLPDRLWLRTLAGILGCAGIVLCFGLPLGWMPLNTLSVALVTGISAAVYLAVWLLAVLQSRIDAQELNAILAQPQSTEEDAQ